MFDRLKIWLLGSAVALSLSACGGAASAPPTSTDTASAYVPIVAASELDVGQTRLPLGVLKDGTPVNDPNLQMKIRLYYLDGSTPNTVQSEMPVYYYGQGLPFGIYVAYPTFDQPGGWAAEVEIPRGDAEPQRTRVRLDVTAESRVPHVGSAAIASDNQTAADVPELKQLTSDVNPDPELYQLSIADALAAQKPFVVMFATPGYCQTAVCSPNMLVLKQLREQFTDRVNFLHVEVYPFPFGESFQASKRVPAVDEWKLRTEPWTFLVDGQGVIQAKYEGGITFVELEPALEQLAAGQPVKLIP